MNNKTAILTVQKWGNSLAVRIPAPIARGVHFHIGTPVEITIQEDGIVVRPAGEHKLTLKERLALFDPHKHRGEEMAVKEIGLEELNDKKNLDT